MRRLALILLLMLPASGAWAVECVVDDPTGTPLNVRASPNGRILGALYNGTRVAIVDATQDGRWARIVPLGRGERGWVFYDYLDCR